MPDYQSVLQQTFPGAIPRTDFVRGTFEALAGHGFTADNTIACLAVCRDEVCHPTVAQVSEVWGEAFNFSSLAGMLFLGRAGFRAAHAHGPEFGGRQRFAYVVLAHIGLGETGTIGECTRPGLPQISHACGALYALQSELAGGHLDFGFDRDDAEFSMLRRRMARALGWGRVPDLLQLTEAAERVIVEDLERMIGFTLDQERADYAILSGLLIHGPEQKSYVRPGVCYAMVNGEKHQVTVG
jgi:hypothetical protein